MSEAVKEALWPKGLAKELKVQGQIVIVYCDNSSCPRIKSLMDFTRGREANGGRRCVSVN